MALHIQMSDDAVRKLQQTALVSKLISFGACTGMLLLFSCVLYFTIKIIQGEIPATIMTYNPPVDDAAPSRTTVTRELSSKSRVPTPTVQPSVIVATDTVGAVAAPVSFDTTGDFSFDSLDVSMDMDADLGDTLGDVGEGLGGREGGSALEGTFYDLKLTKSGNPSKLARVESKDKDGKPLMKGGKPFRRILVKDQNAIMEALGKFFNSNWNPGALSTYYTPKQKLYASAFYLPQATAEYAPIAYQCSDVCQDAGWIAVYRGKVRAPKSGKFRFVGTGDDFLGVRFNKKTVLEAGYRIPSLYTKDDPRRAWVSGAGDRVRHWQEIREGKRKGFEGYELISTIKEIPSWNDNLGGLTAGKVFEVKEGQDYPIEIAISEIPGGAFGFVLLIEDVTNGKTPAGGKYDLFRTNFIAPNKKDIFELIKKAHCLWQTPSADKLQAPPYNEDSPIWTAVL